MKKEQTLRIFVYAALVEGVIALLWLMLIPGDPKSAWLLGFSKIRIMLLASMLAALVFVAVVASKVYKNEQFLQKGADWIDVFTQPDGHKTTTLILSLAGVSWGIYFLYSTATTTNLFNLGYFTRLAPWVFWFTIVTGQSIAMFIRFNSELWKEYLKSHLPALIILVVILIAGLWMHDNLWELEPETWDIHKMFSRDGKFELEQQDIYAIFREGDRLQAGENPYERVLLQGENLEWNQANATYLPVFYFFAWITQEIGLEDFLIWLGFWRIIFLAANLGIAYILFYVAYHRHKMLALACFGALFWLFNRWTLHMTMIYQIDFIAILFLLLSLSLWPKYRKTSLVFFGLSLGVKHIAIFLLPLYVIWIWRDEAVKSIKQKVTLIAVMVSIPVLVSFPFIVWNAEAFMKSVLISATRNSESHLGVPSIDVLLGMSGLIAKLPMVALMCLPFLLAWQKRIQTFAAALFIMVVFVDFNSVLFRQYMTWVVPLIPLAIGVSPRFTKIPKVNPKVN